MNNNKIYLARLKRIAATVTLPALVAVTVGAAVTSPVQAATGKVVGLNKMADENPSMALRFTQCSGDVIIIGGRDPA